MEPNQVKRAVVVGAGIMGHGIAQVLAQAGIEVGLVDLHEHCLDHALKLIRGNLQTLSEHGRVDASAIPQILARVHPSTELAAAARGAEFAVEAVVEVPQVKKEIFQQLAAACALTTIIASNTSSLDVFSLAEIAHPERLVVAHWFAPPHIIPLVEVVPGPRTAPEVVRATAGLMTRLGKRPVVLKQFVPSFIVNRIQSAIFLVVTQILQNGWASIEDIDLAVKASLGIRLPIVGVVQTLDFTGLNLIRDQYQSLGLQPPGFIQERIEKGWLGAGAGKGLYDYAGRPEEEILRRRDSLYLKQLELLESATAFEPV
jgi:3-hydroxybutyryl-CoA dehydrogenase